MSKFEGSFWFFVPSKGAAIFFSIAYFITTVIHFLQCRRYSYFRVTGLFICCGLCFAAGYVLRALGAFGYYNSLVIFIMSVILIAISPPLLALANYHIFGRMMYYAPHVSLMHPSKIMSTFGFLSLIIETLNSLGASFTANPSGKFLKLGQGIMKASLVIQLLLVLFFLFLVIHAHWSCSKAGIRSFRALFLAFYATEFLMLGRIIYRAVEHIQTEGIKRGRVTGLSDLPVTVRYEWIYCIFEASFMLLNMCVWNVWHPRRYLPAGISVCLAADGKTEVAAPNWHNPRSRAARIFDPFDLAGLCRTRRHYRDVSDSEIPLGQP